MKNLFLLILLIIISNCSFKDVKKSHGINNLNKKSAKLIINSTNSNEILEILGPPSTKSELDPNTWIYIERRVTNSSVLSIGKEKVSSNNLLVLKINSRGILYEMELYDLEKMNEIKISKLETENTFKSSDFLSNLLISVRQKINDPIKNRIKKNR
tara:strand:+ start:210 stop:677 length:468 start_codon:yes stop_codon:yes gene_type:complete